MWAVLTDTQKLIEESQCLWPDLPVDIRISKLMWRDVHGKVGALEGFESYGFQRIAFAIPGGTPGVAGVQLIGINGDEAVIVEVNGVTGERKTRRLPRSDLTYNSGLIRNGRG